MNRAHVQLLAWATYLAVLTVILWIWWPHWLSVTQLGSAAVTTAVIALIFLVAARRRPVRDEPPPRDLSVGAALTAIALCGMLYGAEFGVFLVLICAGLLVLGLVQLWKELRADRERRGDL